MCCIFSLCASGIAKISDFGVSHIFEDERRRKSFKLQTVEDGFIGDLISDNEDKDDTDKIDDFNGSTTHLLRRESDQAVNMPSRHNSGMLKKTEGTWCFWSPEMCSASSGGFSGYSADLWAAGVCLYIFTTGTLPFFSMDPSDLFDVISKAEVPYAGLGLSDNLMDLLGKLLEKDPSTRAGVGDCLKHEFCARARTERIDELGCKFKRSEQRIVLSKNDVDMALSITRPQKRASSPKPRTIRVTTSSVSSSAPPTASKPSAFPPPPENDTVRARSVERFSSLDTADDLSSDNNGTKDNTGGECERDVKEVSSSQIMDDDTKRTDKDNCSPTTNETSEEVEDSDMRETLKATNSIGPAPYSHHGRRMWLKEWCRDKLGNLSSQEKTR
jgi:serine/threonine protein kinase